MSPTAQVKFLRVLQEREFQRLGGTKPIKADVRIIAASNRDLDVAMDRGTFREDLYYRLRVFEIRIPPLRERPEDILPLTAAFLDDIGRSFGRAPAGLTREAREVLLTHAWRGNTRELRNVLERAAIVSEGALITPEHLAIDLSHRSPESPATDVKTMERRLIERVLKETKGNKSRAAKRLGLDPEAVVRTADALSHRLTRIGLFLRGNVQPLRLDLDPQPAKEAEIHVRQPGERKKAQEVAAPVVEKQVVAREEEEERDDVVAEAVFTGEDVEELALDQAAAGLAPRSAVPRASRKISSCVTVHEMVAIGRASTNSQMICNQSWLLSGAVISAAQAQFAPSQPHRWRVLVGSGCRRTNQPTLQLAIDMSEDCPC